MVQTPVTLIRNLQRRNARRRQPLAVVEGVRLAEEALGAKLSFKGAAVSPALRRSERGMALLDGLRHAGVPIDEVDDGELSDLADTDSPQGILAVVEPPEWQLADVSVGASKPVLVIDAVQDPGNVGTLLRTAYALGVGGVILLPGCARLTHPKVLRAAMGVSFRLATVPLSLAEFRKWLDDEHVTLWATSTAGREIAGLERPDRLALVVGNEGAGIGAEIEQLAQETVGVPIAQDVDSLNVAVATGIVLHEVVRNG